MTKQKQFLLLLGILFFSKILFAQSTINVTSHTATIGGIVHDYSIGEMTMVTTERTSNLIVTQGVLQPNSTTSKSSDVIIKSDLIDFVKVYPNPTSNMLFIELLETENATFQLYDALGKIVLETRNQAQKSSIDLSSFATGNYYLVVKNSLQETQKMSFKIQKIK